jgi:hypothetical protein
MMKSPGNGGAVTGVTSSGLTVTGPTAGVIDVEPNYGSQVVIPVTSGTTTLPTTINTDYILYLNAAAGISTYTIVLPSNPLDRQVVHIVSSHSITTLTVNAGTGTVTGAPTGMLATSPASFVYNAASTNWYRIS